MLESRVEEHLRKKVKANGGLCIKIAPITAGLPDRMVLFPDGRFYMVETKAPEGRIRPVQKAWHEKARRLGFRVEVLFTMKAVDAWLKIVLDSKST